MDNKKLTLLLLLLSLGITFSASVFGFNFGALRDTAVNNIEQVPQFLNRVINRHRQHSAEKNQNAFQNNHKVVDNERVSFPYANTSPAKYEDQQKMGLKNPTSFPDNWDNTDYSAPKSTFSPLPNKYSHRQESSSNSPISFSDNIWSTDYKGYDNTFNPTTNKDLQGNSFINKVTPGNSQNYAGIPVNIGSRSSFYDVEENSKPLQPENDTKNPADVFLSEHTVASDTDLSTDILSTTDNDWTTTTDEPLNRIGAPPAVVASILG